MVDKALKEGLLLALGEWKIRELKEDFVHEFYRRPFIEGATPL